MDNNSNKSKFVEIGFISETKKSKAGESEKTFMLTISPMDRTLKGIQLNRDAKILLKAPKQGKNQSAEEFEKLKSWKLFSAILIQDDVASNNDGI